MALFDYATIVDPTLKDVRIYISEHLDIKPGERVLDVCCGTGDQAFYFSRKGAVVTGIDLNPGMIQTAEKNRKKRGITGINFYLRSAAAMQFPDGYFDHASISLALHEMERDTRYRVISEMKRAVKKGGALMFTDFPVPMPCNLIGCGIRAIEFLAGRDNYTCFKDYMAQGGLQGVLKHNRLIPHQETLFYSGTVQIIKVLNI